MSEPVQSVRVTNAELATVREAMRELHRLLDQLEQGELEKVVLTQRNQMRAVLITARALQRTRAARRISSPDTSRRLGVMCTTGAVYPQEWLLHVPSFYAARG